MDSLERIAHVMWFMKARDKTLDSWKPEHLLLWLAWFDDDSRLILHAEEGKLLGAMTLRCLWEPEDHEDPYIHEEKGPVIWIDWVVTDRANVFPHLIRQLHFRLGDRETVAFNRSQDETPLIHEYPFSAWRRRFDKWAVKPKNQPHQT